ncbi:MAG: HD domain-containing protein [Mycobacteriales bacterium]
MPGLTHRYTEALAYAAELHRDQVRKGGTVPYLTHLMSVSALVLEAGGDEDQAVAALLHDALEDQGDKTSYAMIGSLFGERVARTVRACSDTEELPKPPWRARKEAYLRHLEIATVDTLLVSAADKLHNARSVLADFRSEGDQVWARFHPDADALWYYAAVCAVLGRRLATAPVLVSELHRTVGALHREVGAVHPDHPREAGTG